MRPLKEIMQNARQAGLVIPAFNIPYLPMGLGLLWIATNVGIKSVSAGRHPPLF